MEAIKIHDESSVSIVLKHVVQAAYEERESMWVEVEDQFGNTRLPVRFWVEHSAGQGTGKQERRSSR